VKFAFKLVSIALVLSAAFPAPAQGQTSDYFEYKQEDRDMKVVGRVYRSGSDVIVEAWPTPRKMRPKVDRLELISPSGKRYKISEIDNFPMSQIGAKRAKYLPQKRRTLAFLTDWLVGTAWANCRPGHEGPAEGNSDDDHSGEAFAGFGLLAGVAGTQEKEWLSAGRVRVTDEPGMWKLAIQVVDDKNKQHSFIVPFQLSVLSTGTEIKIAPPPKKGEREVTSMESVDGAGNTTRVTLNGDGSRTVIVTGADGRTVSQVTHPAAGGAKKTWLDPDTGLRISEWTNADGSVTRRAEDSSGNWSEGNRFPGGKKDPPASAPEPEPVPAPQPEPEPVPAPAEDPGLPPPPAPAHPDEPGPTGPPVVTTGGDGGSILDDLDPTVYGEAVDDGPVGILLQREDDEWVPQYGNNTNVYAKIYEPDPSRPGVWVPSKRKRKISVRFVERSNEKGRCLNRDLPADPQDTPDIFMKAENNLGTTCEEDPAGAGQFGKCTTNDEQNVFTFLVQSEDFGSFSRMEATCDGCAALVPVYGGRPERYPLAVEETREKTLVPVPKDTNKNQISDGYAPDKTGAVRAIDDDEDDPKGNGVKGDGLSAYEEYRGFYNKYDSHNRLDWKKKELFIQNIFGLPGVDMFEHVTGIPVIRVKPMNHRDRVVNFNHGHAHEVDQHCLVLIELDEPGNGLLGYTDTSDFGPPKNCTRVEIFPANHRSSSVADTVVHELGHAIGVHHHGDTATWQEEWYPPGTWRDYNPFAGMTLFGYEIMAHTHDQATLCEYNLPRLIRFGEKHNQSSGAVDCYMRYEYHGRAFRQEDGSVDCIGDHPGFTGFCSVKVGTGFNAGNRVAGDPTVGDCNGQMVINDSAA